MPPRARIALTQLHRPQATLTATARGLFCSHPVPWPRPQAQYRAMAQTPESKAATPPSTKSSPPRPPPIATNPKVDEGTDSYRVGGLHPVYVGDVYNDRYRVLNKIGYGSYSTVWLVRDLTAESGSTTEYQALKILRADAYGTDQPIFEREIMAHLKAGDKRLMGYKYICHMLDTFEHKGPNGTHVCFLFELMGESLTTFGAMFDQSEIPFPIMRRFTYQLLLALDYAHYCKVIHTDIQPANIYIKFRDHSRIESGYLRECPPPAQDREETEYKPVPSRPLVGYYYPPSDTIRSSDFNVTLGDWGVSSWADNHLTTLIQPVMLRAPEVLIGAPWDASADIWNLGAVVYELFRATRLFDGTPSPVDKYSLKRHLAEIVDLFGPFPKTLLDKGDASTVSECFDEKGMIKGVEPLVRPDFSSETWFPRLSDDERKEAASFWQLMMKVDPAERPTPEELVVHPWVGRH